MAQAEANGQSSPSDLEKKIIRQIEYYFGDANLKRDKFLQQEIKSDDGWVSLETMVKFNRLKQLSEDFEVLVTALAKSKSGLIEISEDKLKIRRSENKPIPGDTEENRKDVKARSVYCKGFSLESTLDDVQDIIEKFGPIAHIQMRKDADKKFKGSVFAVFMNAEDAEKFLAEENFKIGEEGALKMSKDAYFVMKAEEKKKEKEDEKERKVQEAMQKEKEEKLAADKAAFEDFTEGCILHFSGTSDQTSREDLKEVFGEHGTVNWVDFVRGQTEGTIRFDDDVKAVEVIEKVKAANDGKIQVRGQDIAVRVLEGEEEKKHWVKVFEDKTASRLRMQAGRKGKRGRFSGRRDKRGYDEPRGKKTKFSDSDNEDGAETKQTEKKEVKVEDKGDADAGTKKRPLEADTPSENPPKQLKAE
ncbi:lupus La protein homolog [Antedon mediterranea]|uniref:lupus La protein homolog n=1 Tax=Antedon mediterranea TaxID=105859 RepID=UPI003AF5BAD3